MTDDADFRGADEQQLAWLFAVKEEDSWRDEEVAAVFRHQLSTTLEDDLHGTHDSRTFGELLRQARPPVELLEQVKEFAKSSRSLPPDAAGLLYLLAIGAALVRTDQRLSTLSDTALLARIDWALTVSWLDDDFAEMLRLARNEVGVDNG